MAMDPIANQGGQDSLHVRRPGQRPHGLAHPGRAGALFGRPARPGASKPGSTTCRACSSPCPPPPYDAKGLMKTAIRLDDPVVFVEQKLLYNTKGPVPEEEYTIPLRCGRRQTRGHGLHGSGDLHGGRQGAARRRDAGRRGNQSGSRRSADHSSRWTSTPLWSLSRRRAGWWWPTRRPSGAVSRPKWWRRSAPGAFDYLDAPIQRVCAPSVPMPFARVMEDFVIVDEFQIADRVRSLVRGEL